MTQQAGTHDQMEQQMDPRTAAYVKAVMADLEQQLRALGESIGQVYAEASERVESRPADVVVVDPDRPVR